MSPEDGLPRRLPRLWERRFELNREDKQKTVAGLKEKFLKAKGFVLTDYKGMTVSEISELRETLRKSSIEYRVVKNTLARIATEETPASPARDSIVGPVGIALGYDDAAMVAKELLEFSKKNNKLKVTSGVIDGMFCDHEQLKTISQLPSREVLLGIMAGTMQAPVTKLGRLLTATLAGFAYAMNALKDKKASG